MRPRILALCFVLAATSAHADDKAKAKHLYEEGLRHFNLAEYPQAIDAWKQAYLISKKPLLLFNLGQAYRLSGDCKQAMTFYDNYSQEEASPKNQDELDQAVAQCKDKLDKPADKPVGKPVEPAPVTTTTTTTTTISAPETHAPSPVTPQPPPSQPAPVAHHSGGGHRTLAIVSTSVGGALGLGAIIFAIKGHSAQNEVQGVTSWTSREADFQASGERDNALAWGLGVVAGAAVVTGVVLIATGGHASDSGVSLAPTRGGAQIGWARAF